MKNYTPLNIQNWYNHFWIEEFTKYMLGQVTVAVLVYIGLKILDLI